MYVDILILEYLAQRPAHGYEIKRAVEEIHGETYNINNNQLYPTLRRFEEMAAITREVVRVQGRPDRHIYSITDRGHELLLAMLRDFTPELAESDSEFETRVAMFHLLEPQWCQAILDARQAVLRRRLAHMDRSLALVQEHPEMRFAERMVTFNQQQIQHELDWIEGLRQLLPEEG